MIGFDQKVTSLTVKALVDAGVSQPEADTIAAANHQACVDEINGFRVANQDIADKSSGLDQAQYPAPANPVYDVYAWQAAFVDLQTWVKANLVP